MAGFVMLAAAAAAIVLAVWVGLAPRRPWLLRALGVASAFALLGVAWQAHLETTGHASGEPLPARFRLLAADIEEPRRGVARGGSIHLWVRPLGESAAAPRAHRLPYDRALHRALIEALRDGPGRRIGIVQRSGTTGVTGNPDASADTARIRFEPAPSSALPPKRGAE